jgi:hypothetical protein
MKRSNASWWLILGLTLVFSGIACMEKSAFKSPPGYDLNNPVKYFMPESLLEISGIALYRGRADSVYAQQDENGRIYYMKLGEKKPTYSKFAGSGDYEDIAIMGDQVFMLRSDGTLYTFPFKQVRSGDIQNVQEFERLLPKGEYEGMYADEKEKQLYVLCKSCKDDKSKNFVTVYFFDMLSSGIPNTKMMGYAHINVKDIDARLGKTKPAFHPSALAKNARTNEWYILSSVNKALVITDAAWKVKAAYPLSAALFTQPEGIAFDNQGNLYISNEGDTLTPGTILKFTHKK